MCKLNIGSAIFWYKNSFYNFVDTNSPIIPSENITNQEII